MNRQATNTLALVALLLLPGATRALGEIPASFPIDLRAAQIVAPNSVSKPERKAVGLLVDEIAARTRIRLPVVDAWPADNNPVIAVGGAAELQAVAGRFAQALAAERSELPPEGFRIRVLSPPDEAPVILVAGNDARGTLYGVGKLLRSLELSRDRITLPGPLDVTTAPAMAIRGHQIGYRPKTNSYDAWDLAQWEQYLRDLAVFGANSIEIIPPRSDDDADSPHFPLPPMEMMIGVSKLADDYGLDVWIWYPAMEESYSTPEAIDAAVKEWGAVLSKLPRVNALFVPSGDPGKVPPGELMAMLARQAEQLERLHPDAKIWISMQSFTQPRFDEMVRILQTEPPWLGGIVHGPQTRVGVAQLRKIVPCRYPLRGYPDITHSLRCEYPVPDWDLAFALTEGRETINPRPTDETTIFGVYDGHVRGAITYSEGCNDDVNKTIWSGLCWDPSVRPIDTLRDYSRYFIGPQFTDDFAQGLLDLERNWRGPLLTNDAVTNTLDQFRAMEAAADPRTRRNWRFQQALYRAHYDAYQRQRLIEETAKEVEAMDILGQAQQLGASRALDEAEAVLDRADAPNDSDPLAARVKELAEALFQSIGMQLSVEKYRAIDVDRGANLDELDVSLNNRVWLKHRFAELRGLDTEEAKLRGIDQLVHWTDPGPGGFYDDLGNPSQQPHLVRGGAYANDPGFLETLMIGFNPELGWRRSWCNYADGLYHTPVTMRYPNLDPHAQYKLRVVYAEDYYRTEIRLVALNTDKSGKQQEIEIHPFQFKPQPIRPIEFTIPNEATSGGQLTLVWRAHPDRGGAGRGCQIAEVWLMKVNE